MDSTINEEKNTEGMKMPQEKFDLQAKIVVPLQVFKSIFNIFNDKRREECGRNEKAPGEIRSPSKDCCAIAGV